MAVLFLFSAALSGCRPSLYRIEPLKRDASPVAGKSLSLGELKIEAAAVLSDEEAFNRFDSNLMLAGILAVEVEISNPGNGSHRIRMELADARGQRFRPMKAASVLKRMMSFEGVRLYPVEAKRNTLKSLEDQALGNQVVIANGQKIRGTLFFDLKADVALSAGLALRLETDGQSASLPLN